MYIESVLMKAKMDIKTLREYNNILKAKVEVMEIFAAAMGLHRENQGAEVDICWEIDKALKQLEDEKNSKVDPQVHMH